MTDILSSCSPLVPTWNICHKNVFRSILNPSDEKFQTLVKDMVSYGALIPGPRIRIYRSTRGIWQVIAAETTDELLRHLNKIDMSRLSPHKWYIVICSPVGLVFSHSGPIQDPKDAECFPAHLRVTPLTSKAQADVARAKGDVMFILSSGQMVECPIPRVYYTHLFNTHVEYRADQEYSDLFDEIHKNMNDYLREYPEHRVAMESMQEILAGYMECLSMTPEEKKQHLIAFIKGNPESIYDTLMSYDLAF